jgi:hypothetical protein
MGYYISIKRNLYFVSPIHFIVFDTTCFGYLVAIFRCDLLYKISRVLMN